MHRTAILVHGIHKKRGQTVEKLQTYLEAAGYHVLIFNYGWTGILGAKFGNRERAKELCETIENAQRASHYVVAIGHSNGCAVIHETLSNYGCRLDHAVYIAPALDPELALPTTCSAASYWYSESDKAVQWPKRLRLIDPVVWGDAGAVGYTGVEDKRIKSFDKENAYPVSSPGHSSIFAEIRELAYFGPKIIDDIESRRRKRRR